MPISTAASLAVSVVSSAAMPVSSVSVAIGTTYGFAPVVMSHQLDELGARRNARRVDEEEHVITTPRDRVRVPAARAVRIDASVGCDDVERARTAHRVLEPDDALLGIGLVSH